MCKKADVLDAGEYRFDYWHATYVNRQKKALFSHWFVDAHSADELAEIVGKTAADSEWRFFCLTPLSPYLQQKLKDRYG